MKFSKERLRELRRQELVRAADTQALFDRNGLLTAVEMQIAGPSPVLSKLLRKLKSKGAEPGASSNAG